MEYSEFNIKNYPHVELRGANHRFLTEGLFYEYGNPEALFTLKTEDVHKNGKTYLSMYRIYMASTDEYEAAEKLLGSQEHWSKLITSKFFTEGVQRHNQYYGLDKWREDMRKRDESLAKKVLMKQTNDGNVNAAKALRETFKATKAASPSKGETQKPDKDDELFAGFAKSKEGTKYVS